MSHGVTMQELSDRAVRDRHDFHRNPELGWSEYRTTTVVVDRLREAGWCISWGKAFYGQVSRLGMPDKAHLDGRYESVCVEMPNSLDILEPMRGGYTGCVAEMTGASDTGPTLGFRFDIDALPITESASTDHRPVREGFVSACPGVMHACGHDAHTAIGLGIASFFAQRRAEWSGRVKLLFQPAEEGTRGAAAMVAAGALDDVDYLLCCHVGAQSRMSGEVIPGVTGFLATKKIDVRFTGREAHAGLDPEKGRNALLAATMMTLAVHSIPRHSLGDSRVNVGVLRGGSARNVVPGEALCQLEIRAESGLILEYLADQVDHIVRGCAAAQSVEATVELVGLAPSTGSDPEIISRVRDAALNIDSIRSVGAPCRAEASDDAAAMMEQVQARGGKASYVILGSDLPSGHHTPKFDVDDRIIGPGIAVLGNAGLAILSRRP